MSSSDITKQVIAQGLKSLMQDIPFEKISIGDITSFCKISRNTFYYHFQDKYELVSWIFYSEITPIISNISDIQHWADGSLELCIYLQKNKEFYINALKAEGQNSFSECLMGFYERLILNILQTHRSIISLNETDQHVYSRFFAYALVGCILDWAGNGMVNDPAHGISLLERIINGEIFRQITDAKC